MKKYIITLFSLLALAQVSAWADKYDAHVSALSGNGSRDNPYIINAAADWAILSYSCGKQNEGELDFSGKYIKLNADITVTTIMGRESGVPFKGHFDGNGHTITVNYTTSDEFCAPFRYVDGATIANLKVKGTINTSKKYAAGIVAFAEGTTTLANCTSSITINSTVNGDGSHGGIVGRVDGDGEVSLYNCLFDGKLLGSSTHSCGGLVGWTKGRLFAIDCLFAPSEVTVSGSNSKTLSRGTGLLMNVNFGNCYYTQTLGDAQGHPAAGSAEAQVEQLHSTGWRLLDGKAIPVTGPRYSKFPGSGKSLENPYIISSAAHWNQLAYEIQENGENYIGRYFRLTADISVDIPLGSSEGNYFGGFFDGAGHTLTCNLTSREYRAPFCYVKGATVQNLHTNGTILTGEKYAAGVMGYAAGGKNYISYVRSSMRIESYILDDGSHGGLVARSKHGGGAELYLYNSLFDGELYGPKIVDEYPGTGKWGGLVGWSNGALFIYNCLFNPSLVDVGDFGNKTLARMRDEERDLRYYSTYYVTQLGDAQGQSISADASVQLSALDAGEGKGHWKIENGRCVPIMDSPLNELSGSGTEEDPYLISSESDWRTMGAMVSQGVTGKYYLLTTDITVSSFLGSTVDMKFKGTFDGGGHRITADLSGGNNVALFEFLDGATVKNLIVDGSFTGMIGVAAIAAQAFGGSTITNCLVKAGIYSAYSTPQSGRAAAFVGYYNSSSGVLQISGCAFSGRINRGAESSEQGAFVGALASGSHVNITDCICAPGSLSFGNTTGNKRVFVGGNESNVSLKNCYNNSVAQDKLGPSQSHLMYSVAPAEGSHFSITNKAATATEYNCSRIVGYKTGDTYYGISYNSVLYTNQDNPTLSLEIKPLHTGINYSGYTASAGTLTYNSGDSYTFDMTSNENVTISGTFSGLFLSEFADNSGAIAELDGKTVTVTLGRTLHKGWNTICLPFNITKDDFRAAIGDNAAAFRYNLNLGFDGNSLSVQLIESHEKTNPLLAGYGYFVYVSSDVPNPVFPNVTISNAAPTEVTDTDIASYTVKYIPSLKPVDFKAGDKTLLFYTGDGFSYANTNGTMPAFRVYLQFIPNN